MGGFIIEFARIIYWINSEGESMNFENAIKPVSTLFEQNWKNTLVLIITYMVFEFVTVYFMIEALWSGLLTLMAQAIITSVFVFEELFYRALLLIFKQWFPLELLLTLLIGIVGMIFLMIPPDFMPPFYFYNFAFVSTWPWWVGVLVALLYPLCWAI